VRQLRHHSSPRMTGPSRVRLRPRPRGLLRTTGRCRGQPRSRHQDLRLTTGRCRGPLQSRHPVPLCPQTTEHSQGQLRSKHPVSLQTTGPSQGQRRSRHRGSPRTIGRSHGQLQPKHPVSLRTIERCRAQRHRLRLLLPAQCRTQALPGLRLRPRRWFSPVGSPWRSPARSSSSGAGAFDRVLCDLRLTERRSPASGAPCRSPTSGSLLQTPYRCCGKR
jgi:hypothetical protein